MREISATPAERQRGEALADAAANLRRATAALQAALEGESNSRRIETLKRAIAYVTGTRRALEGLLQ